jgi:EAL domain-containing protein (putative c-di-GMP-specific phosphodiesterase class I)
MHESLLARVKREEELRNAFAQDQFELYLQPIVRLRSREVIGAESLVRWHHPERGLLTAAQFVPDLEELGLISQLTDWVIGRAVDALVAVRERHPHLPEFEVGFNLGAEVTAPRIVEVVSAALAHTGASAQGLVVEITETGLGEDQSVVADVLQSLRDLGLRVALDDFGTGYSSLSYLATLPVDFLKIDRAFIADVVGVPSRETLLATIVRLGEALRLPTIGEGVEHESEAEMLLELGCTHAQGYLFGRPMPLSALIDSLPRSGVPADARSLEAAPEPAATAPQVR